MESETKNYPSASFELCALSVSSELSCFPAFVCYDPVSFHEGMRTNGPARSVEFDSFSHILSSFVLTFNLLP